MPSNPNLTDIDSLKVCIVGLGLIGASFAKAIRANGFQGQLSAWVRSESTAKTAEKERVVDIVSQDVSPVAYDADVILLAVPMGIMKSVMQVLKPVIRPDAIITDAGSVKQSFVNEAREVFGTLRHVVPGHPIAGLEKSGIDAAEAELFQSRMVLLTPTEETDSAAIDVVSQLWMLTGARVESLDCEHHDKILAATSHLPHVLAFALVDNLSQVSHAEDIFRYAAGGFRDFTRIASGDPTMWRDICLTNEDALLESIDSFTAHLAMLRQSIKECDGDAIDALFKRAKTARDAHVDKW